MKLLHDLTTFSKSNVTSMKRTLVIFAMALLNSQAADPARNSAFDLIGKWNGAVEFGKFKFALVLHIATNSTGRIEATIDVPEQGQRGLPVNALLFNSPEVRLEFDQFGTAY